MGNSNRHSQSDFDHSFDFRCLTNFVKGINLLYKASLWYVCYYVNVLYTPRGVVDISHCGEQNLS